MSVLFRNILALTPMGEVNTNVLVEGERIAYIGTQERCADSVIDGKNKMLIPGMVNAHSHVVMTFMRSAADAVSLETWLDKHIFPAEERLPFEAYRVGALLGFAEMIQSGVTCVCDMYMNPAQITSSAIECGISLNISRGLTDAGCSSVKENPRTKETEELYREFHNYDGGRIIVELGPHAVYACSKEYLEYIALLAQKWGVGINTHLSETEFENTSCMKKYGKTPARLMYDAEIFNSRTIAAHGVWLSDADIALLREKNVSIVNCPESNLKLGSGICDVARLRDAGLNIALGTDGAGSNNNLNIIEEMHTAALLTNGLRRNPTLIEPSYALAMASQNGAKALGRCDCGLIKEGFFADLAMIDIDKPYFYPRRNMLSNLVYSAQGGDVAMTMSRGKILYDNGEFRTIDIERVKHDFSAIAEELYK